MASDGPTNTSTTTQSKIATLALRKVRKLNSQVKELAQRCADLEHVVAQAEAEGRLSDYRPTIPTQLSPRNKLSKKRKVSGAERRASRTDNDRRSALLGAYVASLRVERASRLMNTLAKRRASDAIVIASRKEDADETRTTEGGAGSHSGNVPTTGAEGYTMGCELKRSVFLDRESTSGIRS
ncbi:hypothetical protein PLEOSDRAFT_1101574 [Pleurotus ostreatus PC15]|uniref:Uncharacterized protein n=1 Tax=Pleurotus ostreatus (strain PC15) TaxID=1137138 RepID=A0A067P2E2_PLEO1|nr:hypothetical protein PLEOSDRAFT_1101574 [Pleurotus ostreatus PC15]